MKRGSRQVLRWTRTLAVAALMAILGLASVGAEEAADSAGTYIIFDGSGSMWGQLPDEVHKITAARDVLTEFVGNDFGDRELALRVYGHNRKGDCSDTVLEVPFAPASEAVSKIRDIVGKVNPKGKTPISRSLRAALDDFDGRAGEIILISDGIETCDEDPCELVRKWMEQDVAIKVHVVGLGLQGKEKAAMQCISEAAGTEYQDAGTADELAAGLATIHDFSSTIALKIMATDDNGDRLKVKGTATPPGGEPLAVESHFRNVIPAGDYSVAVGVETRNGTIYKPVTASVTVRDRGETVLEVKIERPPSVRAKFLERGEETRGGHVYAYQSGEEVFSFRAADQVFADPGTYEFRTQPNDFNDLAQSATVAEGEDKELVFELLHTVRAVFTLVAAGSGTVYRDNFELWQGGEMVSKVHRVNGVLALPGTYDLRLPNPTTPYTHKGVVLTTEDKQEFNIEVPGGHVTVIYQFADGTRQKDDYINIFRWTGEKWDQRGKVRNSGRRIPLTPGRYQLNGFSRKGKFDPVEFEIVDGDEKEFILRDQGEIKMERAFLEDLYAHMEWADALVWRCVLATPAARGDDYALDSLHHLHMVQGAYLSVWRGEEVSMASREDFDGPVELRDWARSFYPKAGTFLGQATEAELVSSPPIPWTEFIEREIGGPPAPASVAEMAIQVVTHSVHHRAQVCRRLREVGGSSQMVDYIGWVWQSRPAAAW